MRPSPFRVILSAETRYLAPAIALAVVVLAALPLLTIQAEPVPGIGGDRIDILLSQAAYFSPFYPAIAVALGAFLAAANWLPDVRGRWVYAFTLPVPRERLALLRLGAGAVLAFPPVFALWAAGTLGALAAELPAVVQSHATSIALRFGAATMVVYCAGSLLVLLGRKAWYIVAFLVALVMLDFFGIGVASAMADALFLHPLSPFHALAGHWLFLDV
ncbi:MAG: hypothetical protein M3N43_10160 [Actinomycetota bacterium]|nr:hypothetical protein [Actinomycetota bacterium]